MNHIGLDWGTNYISVGFHRPGKKKPRVAKFKDNGKEKMPSLVYYSECDTLIGEQVKKKLERVSSYSPEERLRFQQGIVRSLKRYLDPVGIHMVPGKGLIHHVDIVRDIFAYVKKDIEAACFGDKAVEKVTLAHPVVCTEAYKNLIITAAFKAGFKKVGLLEEPIAAVMGYASVGADLGRGILVYDFGGGTFDVAFVLQDDSGNFRISIPSMSDPLCGGDNLDIRLYEYWDQKARETLGRPITDKIGEIDAGFLFRCRHQIETLSRVSRMEFQEWIPPLEGASHADNKLSLVLDQEMLNQMFAREIGHTVDITRSMLRKVKDAGHKVDTVILMGGSSKWPLNKKLLKEALPVAPLETMDVAVAMGAAMGFSPEPSPTDLYREAEFFIDKEEYSRAVPTLKLAAERGLADAQYKLGVCYDYGTGGTQDYIKAVRWYRKASEQGHADAQIFLGLCYDIGTGVTQDSTEAVRWYQKAAEQGEVYAQYKLGVCYDYGIGVTQDSTEAVRWYRKAAEQGYPISIL